MAKGARAERQLSNILEDQYQMAALPSGGSGSGTKRPRPDIFAVREQVLDTRNPDPYHRVSESYAIELKARDSGTAQFKEKEIRELQEFAARAGATALVAVKPDLRRSEHEQWYLREVDDLHKTPGGNYSIRQSDLDECAGIKEVFTRD